MSAVIPNTNTIAHATLTMFGLLEVIAGCRRGAVLLVVRGNPGMLGESVGWINHEPVSEAKNLWYPAHLSSM